MTQDVVVIDRPLLVAKKYALPGGIIAYELSYSRIARHLAWPCLCFNMPQNPKRKHHFVPQCLLRQWCDANGKLWEYDAKEGTHARKCKSEVGMEKDFYATRMESEEPDFEAIEDSLGMVESDAAPVIVHLLNRKQGLAKATMIKFIFFVAVQYMRTPGMIERIKALADPEKKKQELLDELAAVIKAEGAKNNEPAERTEERLALAIEFASREMNKFISPKDVPKISAMRQVDTVADAFMDMTWSFLDVFDGEPDLLIGDHPVLLLDAGPVEGYPRPLGLSNEYLQILMPLSPRMVALAGYDVECSYGHILPGVAATINDMTCRFANRFVYGSSYLETAMARAIELRGTGPKTRIRPFISADGRVGFRPEFW